MATIQRFEDIVAWQKSRELVRDVYTVMRAIKDFGFRDQIQRAAVSIMNNIAEGFERRGDKQFKQYLVIAKASNAEVRSMLYVGKDLQYIDDQTFQRLTALSTEISKMIGSLIRHLN